MHVGKAAARSAQAQGRTTAGEGGGRRGARGGPHKGGPGGGKREVVRMRCVCLPGSQAGPGRAEAAAEPGARVDVQPGGGAAWAGPGGGPAARVGDGRRAYGFPFLGLQAEP